MKTPKEKAKELVLRFSECGEDNEMYIETAKKCALLCVDEILDNQYDLISLPYKNYLKEVKKKQKNYDEQ